MLFVDTDNKDGNGLKLEKFRLNISSFEAISTKITKKLIMGCAFLKYFIKYSPHSLSGIFCAYKVRPLSNNFSKKTDPKQQNRREIAPFLKEL